MPFLIIDEKKKATSDGNSFDELPPGVTMDDVSKLILAELNKQLTTVVSEAVDAAFHINESGEVKICRLTGRIVD